jgi:arginine decarboxylase-like protein
MFPVFKNAPGLAFVNTSAIKQAPDTGGVIFAICTVPVMNVRNVVGEIVAAEAIVTGLGCCSDCTVDRFWKRRSLIIHNLLIGILQG